MLEISNKTLIKFERESDASKIIARGNYVQGKSIVLPKMLHITEKQVRKFTNGMPSINGVINNLKIIVGALENFEQFNPDVQIQIKQVKRALSILEV